MAGATPSNPFGEPTEEQTGYALEKIREAYFAVSALENSRERSSALTKLDEARHWVRDLQIKKEIPA